MKLYYLLFAIACMLSATEVLTEAKAAYFRPTNSTVRDIYGSAQGLYTLEISPQLWKNLYGFTSGSFLYLRGHSTVDNSATTLYCIPIGLGLKYLWKVSRADIYLGAGALGAYSHTKNDSPYVFETTARWGYGGVFKLGTLVNKNAFFFDFFTEYTIIHIPFSNTRNGTIVPQNGDLSGWSLGAGIGYRFGGKR